MADAVAEVRGQLGILRLNRPGKLNALNHDMIRILRENLDQWAEDPAISAVVITGEGPRAFCAGGDIKGFRESALAGGKAVCAFWRDEYALIHRIHHYPKPYVALVHGIAMGGGLGLSVPGRYCVAAEDVLCAMPECGIGFFPDVGASWFLSRAPGQTGMYMALTGARLHLADARYAGLMRYHLPRAKWPGFLQALSDGAAPETVLPPSTLSTEAPLAAQQEKIDRIFSGASVEEILERLHAEDSDFARDAVAKISARSPTSLKLAFRAVRLGGHKNLTECLETDLRLACRVQAMADFAEGIRTTVVDKGAAPHWQPAALAQVSEAMLEDCFEPLAEDGLGV